MKSKSNIESFIQQNREAFDDLKAPVYIWSEVRPVQRKVVHIAWKYAAVAASVLVLLLAGYTFGSRQSQQHAERWGEYEEAEKYYTTRVQEKMALISTLGVGDEVLSDIKVLDDVYHQLRAEMMDDPNADPQILLSAMIRHQQQKLSIMEKIVNRVDKYKSNEEGNREI